MKSTDKIQDLLPIGYLFLVVLGILKESLPFLSIRHSNFEVFYNYGYFDKSDCNDDLSLFDFDCACFVFLFLF